MPGEGAGEAGHRVDEEAADEHHAPAEAIRERSEHELGRGQPHEEERDGELRGRRIGAVVLGEGGQGGEEHVDGQGAHPDDGGEEDGDPAESGARRS